MWGCEFSLQTPPCVAHLVCPIPLFPSSSVNFNAIETSSIIPLSLRIWSLWDDFVFSIFSEEILSTSRHDKSLVVSDRATLFNLLIGLDGYTISTGILNSDLNGDDIVSVPLQVDEKIEIGYICHKKGLLSELGQRFLKELKAKV